MPKECNDPDCWVYAFVEVSLIRLFPASRTHLLGARFVQTADYAK
jgi:hypothetical protein